MDLTSVRYLVFSAGGIKGWSTIGALRCLRTLISARGQRLHDQIRGAAGSSIGSVIALCSVVGCTDADIYDMGKKILHEFTTAPIIQNPWRVSGLLSLEPLEAALCGLLQSHYGRSNLTLAELYARTGRDLRLAAFDVTMQEGLILSHSTHADMPVVTAVIASCAIPGLFIAPVYRSHVLVDGAVWCSVPIGQFPLEESLIINLTTVFPPPTSTLSIFRVAFKAMIQSGTHGLVNLPGGRCLTIPVPIRLDCPKIGDIECQELVHLGERALLAHLFPLKVKALLLASTWQRLASARREEDMSEEPDMP